MEKKISSPSNVSGHFGNDLSLGLSLSQVCIRLEDNFAYCFYRKAQFIGH